MFLMTRDLETTLVSLLVPGRHVRRSQAAYLFQGRLVPGPRLTAPVPATRAEAAQVDGHDAPVRDDLGDVRRLES